MDTVQSVLGKMYPFVTAIHMTANYLKWTLHQKTTSIKAELKWHLPHEIFRDYIQKKQLYLELESYFDKALESAVEWKWSLKSVELVRVAEHFIKIENRAYGD